MSSKEAGTERQSPSRWARAYAPAALVSAAGLAVVLAIVFTTALFTTAISRADGPPNLDGAFTLPFKLEQGRPPPVRASSVPRQSTTTPPPPTPTPTPEPVAPSTPPKVKAYPIGHGIIEVEWGQPEGDVDGFQLQVSVDGVSNWRLLAGKARLTDPAGRLYTWYQHHGLPGNQARYYQVRAGNGDAWSDWSASVSATTHSTSSPDLSVEVLGKTSLEITWEKPKASIAITGWTLEVREDAPPKEVVSFPLPLGTPGGYLVRNPRPQDDGKWKTIPATLAAEDRSYTHSGLEPGDTRYYRIRANTAGTTPWSGVAHASTHLGGIPRAPVLTVKSNGQKELVLSWTRPADGGFEITSYEFQYSWNGQEWRDNFPSSAISHGADETIRTLYVDEPGTTRYYRVRARSASGHGPWSNAAGATTENGGAGMPKRANVTSGITWVEITWTEPQAGESPITGYQVQRAEDVTPKYWLWKDVGATDAKTLTFRDTGLKPRTGYSYRVAARDSQGLGPWTFGLSPSERFGAETKPPLPDAPTITARAGTLDGGPGQNGNPHHQWIDLTWTVPTIGYGFPRQFEYQVVRSANGKDGWKIAYYGLENKHRDMEVEPGETWHYRVHAAIDHWDYGFGPWSNVISATARAALPEYLPFMTTGDIGERSIEISWQPPDTDGGSPVTGYEIQFSTEGYRDKSKFKALTTPSATASAYTHRNLQPDTRYCYRYRAKNKVGWSNWQDGPLDGQCFRTLPQTIEE